MAGDPLRDAFRAELETVRVAASVPWAVRDTLNTADQPDASTGYLELEFPGGSERQYSTGAPGANLHEEIGQVTIRVVAPLRRGRDLAEAYAAAIRTRFRARRFAGAGRTIAILETAPLGDGHDEGGVWAESLGLRYRTFNVG